MRPVSTFLIMQLSNSRVDCDCDSHPAEPEMADLGIFASVDPVAVDQACYDAVVNSPDAGIRYNNGSNTVTYFGALLFRIL